MKVKFLALVALVLGMVSCQNDFDGANVGNQGEVDFTLNVAVPELTTRAAGSSSAASGLDNIDLDSDYDVRYLLEVYDANGALAKERFTNYEDKAATTSFNLRLIPGRKYTFVVWADFVRQMPREEGKNYDLHYVTTNAEGLKNVTVNDDTWKVIDESRDAYTGKHTEEEFKSSSSITINLTRPFAKLRVVTTDIKELGPLMPKTATVNYTSKLYTSFNAYTATAGDLTAITDTKVVDFATDTYGDEANPKAAASKGEMTLFADYFFGAEDDKVLFTMDVVDSSNQTIPTIVFNTNIPVQRNYLTTVKGPILTDSNNITVTIDDAFANGTEWNPSEDKYDVDVWNGTSMNAPVDSDGDGVYEIGTGAQLAYLAAAVNGTLPSTASTRAEVNWATQKYILTQNLNLGGNEWTPIGGAGKYFAGTFDGQGNSVENFQVTKQEGRAALFGNARATIKNLTVENVKIEAHHYAGAIVGQGYAKIEGCHVNNIDITLTTKDGDWGDKAGGIIGQNCEGAGMYVKNSTAKNVTIKGYRDLGGIAGMAHYNNTVSGCKVENITILQDLSVNYEDETPTTLGAVIGRKGTNVVDTDNTVGEGIKIAVMAANREQLQAALSAAKAGETLICLCADIEGDVTVEQKPDVKITVDGCDYNYVGEITVDGKSQAYATAAFTVKNVNFTLATGDVAINLGVSGNSNTRYASNVTIEGCTFTGTDKTAAAIKTYTGGGKNLTVANCKATGLHSLTQLHNIEGVAISGCEVVGGKNGIALGHSQDVTISDTEVACVGYGVRADGTKENVVSVTITDCNFDAYIPVTVREMTEDACVFKLTHTGDNTLTKGGDYHIAICSNEYEEGKTPVAPKGTIELSGAVNVYAMFPVRPVHAETGLYWNGETKPHKQRFYVHDANELATATAYFAGQSHSNVANTVTIDLVNDIDLAGVEWNPWSVMFITVNGNNHTISNLSNSFFGYAGAVTVNNLTLENVTASGNQAGTFAACAEGAKFFNCFLKGNNKVTFVDDAKVENGVGAISGITINSNLNVTITEGTNVEVDMNTISNTEKTTFDNILTGYKHTVYATNSGTITNNGNVSVKVAEEIVANSKGTGYSGELFEEGATDFFVLQNSELTGDAKITLKRTYNTVALEGVTANINDNLIVAEKENTIILYDCDITLAEGKKLIVTVGGATIGQVSMHNVKVNGETLTRQSAANFMEGVNWYEVW